MVLTYSHDQYHDPIEEKSTTREVKKQGEASMIEPNHDEVQNEWDYLSFTHQLQDLSNHSNIDISPSISNQTIQTVHSLRPSFSSSEYETDNTEFLGCLVDNKNTIEYNFNQGDIDASFQFLDNVMEGGGTAGADEPMTTTPLFMSDETHETSFLQLQNEWTSDFNNVNPNQKLFGSTIGYQTYDDEFVTSQIYEWPNDEMSGPVNLLNNIQLKRSNLEPKTISEAVSKTIKEEFLIQDLFLGDSNITPQHHHPTPQSLPQSRSIRKRNDQDVEWTPLSVYKAYTNIKSPTNGKEAYNHLVPYSSCIGTLNYRPKDHAAWKRSPNRRR
ncbi:hypothetical protein JA1_000862 [Spathaspora sp. JA1]|nr:hypothetical protein JA1_000862 [Spathaspora sp. JA1]